MSGAIHSLPQYLFTEWCSVKKKAQGQLYLYPLPLPSAHSDKYCNATLYQRTKTASLKSVRNHDQVTLPYLTRHKSLLHFTRQI